MTLPTTRPSGIRTGAVFAARLLVIAAAIGLAGWVAFTLANVVVPLLVGVVVAALLVPFSALLQRHGLPRWIAVVLALLSLLAGLALLVFLVVWRVSEQLPGLERRAVALIGTVQDLLRHPPLGLPAVDLDSVSAGARSFVEQHATALQQGVVVAGATLVHLGEGLFIVTFVTIFSLTGGRRMWEWMVSLFPRAAHHRLAVAGAAGWTTLTHFIRVQVVIAATDALGIALGAFLLGVPLAGPIGVVVFVGAFVPVVGAFAAGAVAVLLALLFQGWVTALVMLGVVVLVQQLEGQVLHPFLTGSVVAVHPLAVLLAVIAGTTIGGIAGGFFAVPLAATANAMIRAARQDDPDVPIPLPIPASAEPRA
ncbi:AI-2E family transporter [Curtobacterium sp. C1]|uniref:AI-2E family transporter n=1 Tax=Curtobacterium sp. C1 TaxID=2898151 RepID=UPI001E60F65E|nr:AI-2E family transporter [Curtobacterium sp. C1]UFU15609.1 AI-2E family transporter [Curtobacterium sp. C1]